MDESKATITYISSRQVAEDSWAPYTEVIHISMDDTIAQIKEKHFKRWAKSVHVELHISLPTNK